MRGEGEKRGTWCGAGIDTCATCDCRSDAHHPVCSAFAAPAHSCSSVCSVPKAPWAHLFSRGDSTTSPALHAAAESQAEPAKAPWRSVWGALLCTSSSSLAFLLSHIVIMRGDMLHSPTARVRADKATCRHHPCELCYTTCRLCCQPSHSEQCAASASYSQNIF